MDSLQTLDFGYTQPGPKREREEKTSPKTKSIHCVDDSGDFRVIEMEST